MFCDLRGFTAFAETAEPEEVMAGLRRNITRNSAHSSTARGHAGAFLGDGLLVLFNDPMRCPDPSDAPCGWRSRCAIGMDGLAKRWRGHGHELGLLIGSRKARPRLARSALRVDPTMPRSARKRILAARLCAEAKPNQILVSGHVMQAVDGIVEANHAGDLRIKGFSLPVAVHDILRLAATSTNNPN